MIVLKQWETKHLKKVNRDYQYHIKIFLETAFFTIEQASYNDIIQYLQQLRKTGASVYVLKNRLTAIKFYYHCLLEFEYMDYHPCANLVLKDKLDKQKSIASFYTEEELTIFLKRKISKNPNLQLRNQVLQYLLVYQGLTITELVNLEVMNINLENCTITVKESYLNQRVLSLEAIQLLPLQEYLTTTRKHLLKNNITQLLLVSKNGKKIPAETLSGMLNKGFTKKFIPKRIRQSVIMNLLKRGNDLRSVQLFAGYKDITTVENYKENDIAVLQKAIQTNHPLG